MIFPFCKAHASNCSSRTTGRSAGWRHSLSDPLHTAASMSSQTVQVALCSDTWGGSPLQEAGTSQGTSASPTHCPAPALGQEGPLQVHTTSPVPFWCWPSAWRMRLVYAQGKRHLLCVYLQLLHLCSQTLHAPQFCVSF